jgi:chemosensory pili system protein ChpA (sensor histidine kinase/response regulator)
MRVDPDILPIFLEEADGYLRVLRSETADAEQRLVAAHGLKGAASILDVQPVLAAARAVESALRERRAIEAGTLDEIEKVLARLRGEVDGSATATAVTAPTPTTPTPTPAQTQTPEGLEEEWDPDTARMLRALFAEEANDHLEAITTALLRFDRMPASAGVEAMLRKAHTLKGSASTVGLPAVSEAAHDLEEELIALRSGSPPAPDRVDRLLAAVDVLRTMVASVDTGESAAAQLQRFSGALTGKPATPRVLASTPDETPTIPFGEALLTRAEPPGSTAERRAGMDRRQDDQRVRVEVSRLDRLMNVVGELVIDRTRVERRVEELKGLARDLGLSRQALRAALGDLRGLSNQPAVARLGEIEVEVADAVQNLDRATADLLEDSEALRRTSHALQELLGQVRMIPIHWLHARLQRPLRGMARSQGKQVELIVADESSEMDRSIAEQVTDSLLQLIRNAVAHGIETPDARVAAGKPPVGRIRIMARHQADFVYLEVEDDGAGIDPAVVREVLRRQGKPADERSDVDVLDHIFDSGFSTRPRADSLSGRGVGLDVVRENIHALGGTISVSSEMGAGTRFCLRIPMTTAIAQALLFKIGDPVYAIPVAHVVETLFVQPGGVRERDGKLEVQARNSWLPLLNLHRLLGADAPIPLQRFEASPGAARLPVVILLGGSLFGITCTRVIGPREIVLKRLGRVLASLPIFAGATISGSSKVQFVLDVTCLSQLALGAAAGQARSVLEAGSAREGGEAGALRVLLADDSRSIREAVAQILRGAGYSVDVAADGWEAWERLQRRSYDLLMTDLEMPRLHGYDLIAKCRGAAALASLPIIVLTSRTAERNREAALQRGASDFIAKPINRRVVLEHVRTLLRQ